MHVEGSSSLLYYHIDCSMLPSQPPLPIVAQGAHAVCVNFDSGNIMDMLKDEQEEVRAGETVVQA